MRTSRGGFVARRWRRVLFLYLGHGSSFPARVIVARHTVPRKISRNRRQPALPNAKAHLPAGTKRPDRTQYKRYGRKRQTFPEKTP